MDHLLEELERVLDIFRANRSINAITCEVFGIEPGSRAWQNARQHVEGIIRSALGGDDA